jgi:hypothetical protein
MSGIGPSPTAAEVATVDRLDRWSPQGVAEEIEKNMHELTRSARISRKQISGVWRRMRHGLDELSAAFHQMNGYAGGPMPSAEQRAKMAEKAAKHIEKLQRRLDADMFWIQSEARYGRKRARRVRIFNRVNAERIDHKLKERV